MEKSEYERYLELQDKLRNSQCSWIEVIDHQKLRDKFDTSEEYQNLKKFFDKILKE